MLLLFFTSFLAATLVPAQSEALLAAMHVSGKYDVYLLVVVATAGNVLGSCVNWLIGRYALHFQNRKWFPVKPAMLARATGLYQRYGVWTLLFAWLPFIGDAFTVIAGLMRTHFALFAILVTIGKLGRYIAVVLAF